MAGNRAACYLERIVHDTDGSADRGPGMILAGQVAVVTGAGSGMGRAIAHGLADQGCRVVAVGRREEKLIETVDTYEGSGSIVVCKVDVGDRVQVEALYGWINGNVGPTDILVNNAGINIRDRALSKLSLDDWDKLIQINLTGVFHMIHGVLPTMRERKTGLIINISSVAGIRPSPLGGAAYTASKFGVSGLTGVVALEEARHGIRCSSICPGEVATPILDQRPEPVSAERRAAMVQPEDIAAAVVFIARLPPRAHVPELIIKPTLQEFA
jgi:NADP-dependent 3-hydroxy acid dehydrogenase YdfG